MASTGSRLLSSLLTFAIVLSTVMTVGLSSGPLMAQTRALPASGVVNTEDTRLNMRSGPGTSFALVAKLDPGTAVEVLAVSDDGDWYQIAAAGTEGWAAAEYIRMDDDAGTVGGDAGQTDPVAAQIDRADGPQAPMEATNPVGAVALLAPTAVPAPQDSTAPRGIMGQMQEPSAATDAASPAATSPAATAQANPAGGAVAESAAQSAGFLLPTPTAAAPSAAAEDAGGPRTNTVTADAAPTVVAAATPEVPTPAPSPTPTPAPAVTYEIPTALVQPARMNVRSGPGTGFAVVTNVAAGTALEVTGETADGQWYRVRLPSQEEPGWLFAGLTTGAGPMDQVQVLAAEEVPEAPTPEPVAQSAAPPVVAAPPPAGAGFFGYGVQAHMLGGGAGGALTAISDLGFNWVKQQVEWKLFGPDPGVAGFGELHGIVNEAGNRGINVLFSVVNAPGWAREPGFDGSVGGPPADPQTYAAFVGAMAGQFCNTSLKAIEVWNEQNLHYEWGNKPLDPAEYMNLLKAAYGAIKAACPSMLVISGALTPAGSNPPFAMDDFAYLEAMYQNGLANYSDGIGAHPSGYNVPASVRWEEACSVIQQTGNSFNGACDTPHHSWSFRSTMEGYRNIMNVYGDSNKRIWPTEFGWAAGGAFDPRYAYANDNSLEEQAAWTVEAYTMMRDWGWVGPAFLWNLNFRVVADGTEKAQWGIVRNDYSPLPVYDALKAMPK